MKRLLLVVMGVLMLGAQKNALAQSECKKNGLSDTTMPGVCGLVVSTPATFGGPWAVAIATTTTPAGVELGWETTRPSSRRMGGITTCRWCFEIPQPPAPPRLRRRSTHCHLRWRCKSLACPLAATAMDKIARLITLRAPSRQRVSDSWLLRIGFRSVGA